MSAEGMGEETSGLGLFLLRDLRCFLDRSLPPEEETAAAGNAEVSLSESVLDCSAAGVGVELDSGSGSGREEQVGPFEAAATLVVVVVEEEEEEEEGMGQSTSVVDRRG